MATVIVLPDSPTDEQRRKYESHLEGIRRLASPNAAAPLTKAQLPDDFITDPVYLDAAERFVARKTKASLAAVRNDLNSDPASDSSHSVLYLIQLRVAIRLIPQLPLILRQTMVGETIQIQDFDLEKRLMELEDEYNEEAEETGAETATGRLRVKVTATDKLRNFATEYSPWPPSKWRW